MGIDCDSELSRPEQPGRSNGGANLGHTEGRWFLTGLPSRNRSSGVPGAVKRTVPWLESHPLFARSCVSAAGFRHSATRLRLVVSGHESDPLADGTHLCAPNWAGLKARNSEELPIRHVTMMIVSATAIPASPSTSDGRSSSHASGAPSSPCLSAFERASSFDG